MVCGLCGNKIKKKAPRHTKKESDICDKCYNIYVKQNRQMQIETAVYGLHNGLHKGGHNA